MTIVNFITIFVFYLLGYIAGYISTKDKQELIQNISYNIKKKLDTSPVGVVKRPTQIDILKRTDPLEKKIEEGKQAMSDTLKNIKDLE